MGSKTSFGPFGGDGGTAWDDGVYTSVRWIKIHAGDVVDSICFGYEKNGEIILSPIHGESVGGEKHMVKFDYRDEFLISISGYYGPYMDYGILIQSLTFQTNRKTYGPFGREIGDQFSVSSAGRRIIGFYGRSGLFLDSIGAYVSPVYISVGPFGFRGNNCWDDGVHTTVRQLIISVEEITLHDIIIFKEDVITSIFIEYDQNGQSVSSPPSNRVTGGETHVIKLHYPDEFLISFSGYSRSLPIPKPPGGHLPIPLVNRGFITSLTFQTNWKTYGPFGKEIGDKFLVPPNIGKIVGFNGSNDGNFLSAIGAHLEKFPHPSVTID